MKKLLVFMLLICFIGCKEEEIKSKFATVQTPEPILMFSEVPPHRVDFCELEDTWLGYDKKITNGFIKAI